MTWKYKPYSLYNCSGRNGGHYSLRPILSYNCKINLIIGARGIGKTFSTKELLLNQFLEKGKKFAWVRDTVDAKKELCDNDGVKFYEDFPLMENPNFKSGSIKKSEFIINEKHAGTCLPASVFQRYKGNSFQSVSWVVYDEFIREKGRFKNKNNLWATINTLMTICRSRDDIRIIMLGNALDKGDEFLNFLGVEIDDFGFYYNKEKSVCIHYADNTEGFIEKNSNGVIGKLLIGTNFADNLMESKFLNESHFIFDKLPKKSKLLFIIETPLQSARFYTAENRLYVMPDINKDTYLNKRYVASIEYATRTKPLLSLIHRQAIRKNMEHNNILYKNNYMHKFINELF